MVIVRLSNVILPELHTNYTYFVIGERVHYWESIVIYPYKETAEIHRMTRLLKRLNSYEAKSTNCC